VTENPNLAPPGWYLVFLCNKAGIPSVARWIHLERAASVPRLVVGEKAPRAHDHRPGFPIPGFPPTDRE